MKQKKDKMIEAAGEEKYKKDLEIMQKIADEEGSKGKFEAIEGQIDEREEALKDGTIIQGFYT